MTAAPWPQLKRGLVAILRGVTPDDVGPIGDVLVEYGIEAIEVPLNSPQPFASIERLARALPETVLVGAGTVLTQDDVRRLDDVGGRLLVSPNVDADVLRTAAQYAMVTMPGVFTPTEAFLALRHGASALKFFPANVLGVSGVSAIRAVLPSGTLLGAVGGIGAETLGAYVRAGVSLFGLGTSLYKPELEVADVARRAEAIVTAYDEAVEAQ